MPALRSSLFAATAAILALVAAPGVAYADPTAELASSPAQRCLFPAAADRVKPVYPPKLYESKQSGTVEVEFEFTAPDRRPRVHVDGESRQEFQAAIEDYAKQLRVPCMSAGDEAVKLRQTFVFVPNDGRKVAWTTPVDEADPGRRELMKCLVKPATWRISYPSAMVRQSREATVLLRARFFDAAKAPTYELLSDGGDPSFGEAVDYYIGLLRLPCLAGAPIEENFRFEFHLDGGGSWKRRVLKDLPLSTFLAVVKPIPADSVFFDTNTMKCPFDVRLTFQQPFEPNKIEELEEDVPARHPFLDWLGQREFDLDRKQAGELLGQQMTVHIPCVTIDL